MCCTTVCVCVCVREENVTKIANKNHIMSSCWMSYCVFGNKDLCSLNWGALGGYNDVFYVDKKSFWTI